MNLKVFEYQHKDVPFLKKEIIFRLTFALLFFVTFVWQFASMIISISKQSMTVLKIISTIFVLIICLVFSVLSLLYAIKTIRVIDVINSTGRCVSSVDVLFKIEKDSFVKLYKFITEILTLIASLVLISAFTYNILEVSYYSNISYFLPLLLTISLSGYCSVFHIQNEITIMKTVNEYNRI